MKYLIILGDGMADYRIKELDDMTPLQYAKTPNLDKLAKLSLIGLASTIPDDFPPGSDVANLAVLGYDPRQYYSGRSPLEAVSMGVALQEDDLALRCNLVTLSDDQPYNQKSMTDYSSGEINSCESAQLIQTLQANLGNEEFSFYPGVSYRHLVVWKGARNKQLQLTPPHDITDQKIAHYLPSGNDARPLMDLMLRSTDVLCQHPINQSRIREGLRPATSIWFWGEGGKPAMDTLSERYHLKGSVIGAVDLVRGLGICAGLEVVKVPGATGGIETNFSGKARAALDELHRGQDFVYLHIESPDEAGHQGNVAKKIWSIEQIDEQVVGLVMQEMASFKDFRLLILPDHPTPISIKTHSREPVPFLLFDLKNPYTGEPNTYNEEAAASGYLVKEGHQLMDYFINGFPKQN